MNMNIVIASDNPGKINELQDLLNDLDIQAKPQSEYGVHGPEETGLSFIENALLKARHCAKITELPAIADDSGLCVDALGQAPGIFSARYAGVGASSQDNMDKLLSAIQSLKGEDRSAYFYCAMAYVRHANDPTPIIALGQWHGRILEEPVGSEGFGYDPIFFIPALNASAAQLEKAQKNSISHRAKALKELHDKLKIIYGNAL